MSLASAGSPGSSVASSSDRSSSSAGFHGGPSQQQLLRVGEDKHFLEFPRFSEEEIKKALKAEAEKHAMWKTAAVKRMKIVNIDTSVAFRYTVETFTETRSTYEVSERYGGRPLDPSSIGELTTVWDMVCHPQQMFMEDVREMEMPGTVYLLTCETCHGQADSPCYSCRGAGSTRCSVCNGTGMRTGIPHPLVGPGISLNGKSNAKSSSHRKPIVIPPAAISAAGLTYMDLCHVCQGQGIRECNNCKGKGKRTCVSCDGSGQVRKCTMLKVRFNVDKSDYIHECGLPDEVLRRVTGEVIFNETRPYVYPMKNFPIEKLNDQSRRLVQSHLSKHDGSAKILQQRHTLEAIPVAAVFYDLNGQKGTCWVVGLERMAHVPNYPKKCCIL